jgi:hypothetical protein
MGTLNTPGRGDCLPRDDAPGDMFAVFEDSSVDLIPRSEWKAAAKAIVQQESLVRMIKNQGQEGSCASNATAQAMEMVYNRQRGIEGWVELSAMSLYKRVGRSSQSGSTIGSNLREVRDIGILPSNSDRNKRVFKHTFPPRGWNNQYPSGWKYTANMFRVTEWFDITSFDGFVTALLMGFPVVYGRAGHAICGVRPEYRYGKWHIRYANSWDDDWGDEGFGWDSESFISKAIASYGAFAPRVTTNIIQPKVKK